MNRARLKRPISPRQNFGREDGCRDNVDLKRFRQLTDSFGIGHETSTNIQTPVAVGDYEKPLVPKDSVATSLVSIMKRGMAATANSLTCVNTLQSDRKVQNLDDIKGSQQLPKTSKHDYASNLLSGTRQSSQHNIPLDITSELPVTAFMTDKQVAYDRLCTQRINQSIDECKNVGKEKKHREEATKHLLIQILDCPICGKKLKTQNARHLHVKKCAVTFCISSMDLIELIKKQEHDHQLQLLGSSSQEMREELASGNSNPPLTKKKKKRLMKNWFKEPHSKLEEDIQLAIALSTSVEDRRNNLADFVNYSLPPENKPKEEEEEEEEEETENIPLPVLCLLPPPSKDAFLRLMSQKTKESSLLTKCEKKYKTAKQPSALLALNQDEVRQRLAEKATALLLKQLDFSAFYNAFVPCLPKSKLAAKYSYQKGKDFLWCLASKNMENLCTYYVKNLVPPVVPKDAEYSSLQQKHLNWQMSDERPEQSQMNEAVASFLYGSTETALILAELAADAGSETSFSDDFFPKSLSKMRRQPLPSAADADVIKGFCLATDEVCDKASIDLHNAWSRMVDNAFMSDLTLECHGGEVVRLHRLVLMARYPNLLQIIESESSKVVFSQFSKMAALALVSFVYSANTDVHHLVVFEAKRLAESVQLTDFCEICENVIKTYDLVESVAPEACAAALEDLIKCGWSDGSNQLQRDKEISWNESGKIVEKKEDIADLDEVYAFMLTQRRNQMSKGGTTTEDEDNESDTSMRSKEDNNESLMKTGSQLYDGSGDKDQNNMLFELNQAACVCEKLSGMILSGKSHKVKSYASWDSAEDISVDAKIISDKILSEKKECSSVQVELFGEKVEKCLDSLLIDSLSENSNRTIDLVAVDEAERCLSNDDDDDDDNDNVNDEKGILPHKSSEEFASGCSAAAELNHDKEDTRERSHLWDGSHLSFYLLRTDCVEHPLDSTDCYPVDSFDTSKQGEKEPMVSYTSLVPLKLASSSFCCCTQGLVPSSCHATGSSDAISGHTNSLVSSCVLSNDSLSPDLFPSSPFSGNVASPVVSVQEPHMLLQAVKKLKYVLDTDKVFREELETSGDKIDCARNLLTESSRRDVERQKEEEYEKYRHIAVALKKNSYNSIYHEKSMLETPWNSQVRVNSLTQENHFDAECQFLSEVTEKLTDENFLPDLDDDDDHSCEDEVQNPTETTCGQNMTATFLNCNKNCVNKDNKSSNNNEIEVSARGDEVLFPHGMRTLHLSSAVEIGTRTAKMYESFQNSIASHSKSLSSCRINSTVMTSELEDVFLVPENKTSEDIPNAEISYEECSEKKRQSSFDDVAISAASDVDVDHDNENTAEHISIQCGDELSTCVLDSNRTCDEEKIWENFAKEELVPHASLLTSTTPESLKMHEQYTASRLNFSPLTDLETDMSAVMEDFIANSSLLNSNVSFETSSDTASTVVDAKSLVASTVLQVSQSDLAGTSVQTVTPLPSYGLMNTPALQQHCHDYGIRRLPKKQMVRVLENIYFDLHPGISKPDTVKPKQNFKKRMKTEAKKGNLASFVTNRRYGGNIATHQDSQTTGQPATVTSSGLLQGKSSLLVKQKPTEISVSSNGESDDHLELECPKQDSISDANDEANNLECVSEEGVLIQKKKKTKLDLKSKRDDSVKKEILMSFFSKNTDLYQRILNYEPLELDCLKKLLKENGIKVASYSLIDFLNEQNILFTTRNSRVGWNSRRLPAK